MSVVDWSAPFEDLRPGQELSTRGRTVTEADVVGFAALTGDWHPQHADAAWAADSRFGERIAHGMLILSYAVGLMPFDPDRVVALRRVTDVVFKRPLRIGETICAEGRINSLAALGEDTGLVACAWSVLNQDMALVCRARIDVLWRRGELSPRSATDDFPTEPGEDLHESAHERPTASSAASEPPPFVYPSGVFPC
ncbi:MAG: MaoC/PaaZ C-terminal domain-containing protein [Solirubrobacteraceae bacterium]